jgi:hypothetical protein
MPSPNGHARTQGTAQDRIRISKAFLFNDIDRWVLRCALVVVSSALDDTRFAQRVGDFPFRSSSRSARIQAQVPDL